MYCIYKIIIIIIICTALSRLVLHCAYCYFNDKFCIHFGGSLEYWMNEWMDECRLQTVHIPLYVSSHTEYSAVSGSGLLERSRGSRKKPKRFEEHHVVCRLSIYRCIWVHTQSTVLCRTVVFVKDRRQPEKAEALRATPCRLQTVHIPLYVSSHTEHSAVSDSGLRESSWGSQKKTESFRATPCRSHTAV